MKVLIVGGAGFVGAQLAFYLKGQSYDVVVMDSLARRGTELNILELQRRNIGFFHGDVRNQEDFLCLPSDIEVICHTAAQPSVVLGYANPVFDVNSNTLGTVNVLEFARHRRCGLIFWSTNKVYSGDIVNQFPRLEQETRWIWDEDQVSLTDTRLPPGFDPRCGISEDFSIDGGQHSIYGLTKVMADLACQEYYHAFDVPTVVNRFSCLAGPGQFGKTEQGWVTWFAAALYFDLPIRLIGWGGKQVRDILFIEDVCSLVELEINNLTQIGGHVFNIGGGTDNTLSLLEAISLLEEIYGRQAKVTFEEPARKSDQCIYVSDIRKVQQFLGWQPSTKIDEGYKKIVAWLKSNESLLRPLYDTYLAGGLSNMVHPK